MVVGHFRPNNCPVMQNFSEGFVKSVEIATLLSTQEAPCSIRTLSERNYDIWDPIFLEDYLSSLLHLKKVLDLQTNPFYTFGCLVVKRALSMSLHPLSLMYAHFSSASLSLRDQANALVNNYHCCSNWRTASNSTVLCPQNLCIGVKVLIAFCGN